MRTICLLSILTICLLVQSCADKTPAEPQLTFFDIQGENGFVGTVQGTDAYIAILAGESEAVAYVCNGDEKISEWFKGAVSDPTVINLNNDKNARISAQFTDGSFRGEMTLKTGVTHAFRATPGKTVEAGIYRVMGDEAAADQVEAGWILLSSGEERGALKVRSIFQKTPPLPRATAGSTSYPVFHFIIQPPGPVPPVPIPYPHFPLPIETTKPGE